MPYGILYRGPYCLIITLIMEAVSSSETAVDIYQTTLCDIPEDTHLHTHRRENPSDLTYRKEEK
jgi:hypothetical protein